MVNGDYSLALLHILSRLGKVLRDEFSHAISRPIPPFPWIYWTGEWSLVPTPSRPTHTKRFQKTIEILFYVKLCS